MIEYFMKYELPPEKEGSGEISRLAKTTAQILPDDVIESAPSGVVLTNSHGMIIRVNKEAEKILGMKADRILGSDISTMNVFAETSRLTLDNTAEVVHKNNGQKLLISKSPVYSQGKMVGRVYIFHDISSLEADELQSMHNLNCKLESLIEGSHDGIILTDHEKILKINSSFSRISGLKKESVEGKAISQLADSPHVCLKSINEVFYTVHKKKKSVTIMRKMHKGNEIYITGTPALCKGKITHVTVNIRDLTELQRLQEQVSRLTALYLSSAEDNQTAKLLGEHIVAESRVMRHLIDLAVRVANVDSVVFIQGESGTGKEVLARLIHSLSSRSKGPFISINCGAIPENLLESELFGYEKGSFTGAWREGKPGLFELANGGIIFLDEIGEMPLSLQVKLLKVLQDKEVYRLGGVKPIRFDVRIIAATNRKLRDMVKEGKFREDLFYRLYVVPIEMPPLRERREDIFPLAWHYLKQYNQKYKQSKTLSSELIKILESYSWPGNVRELQNIVERLVVTSDTEILKPEHLPHSVYQKDESDNTASETNKTSSDVVSLSHAKEQVERTMLAQAIKMNQTTREIASLLGIDHSTVVRKIQKYGLRGAKRHQKSPS